MTDDGRNRNLDIRDLADSRADDGANTARSALVEEAITSFRNNYERKRPDEINCQIFPPPKADEKIENSAKALTDMTDEGMWDFRENEKAIIAILTKAQKHGDIEELIDRTNEMLKQINPDLELSITSSSRTLGFLKFTDSLVTFDDNGDLTKIARPMVEIHTKTPIPRGPNRFPPELFHPTPFGATQLRKE